MTHPYLADPERAAAFAYLVQNPSGSIAKWAAAFDWTPSKFRRFIAALIKLGLAEIEHTAYGSRFRPTQNRHTSDTLPAGSRHTSGTPHQEAVALDSGLTGSRCEPSLGTAEGMMCIAIVNEVLGANFKDHGYRLISADNFGSHRAVKDWIDSGMSLADMTRLLREKAAVFHPKYLANEEYQFPKSLAYFTRWIRKTWAIERRQIPLPLMTKSTNPPRTKLREPVPLADLLPKMERG